MKICSISITNFKSIRTLTMNDVDSALILVGKNSTGKTVILDAILAAAGLYTVKPGEITDSSRNMEVHLTLFYSEDDLIMLNKKGVVSKYKRFPVWFKDFCGKLPSFHVSKDNCGGELEFTFVAGRDGSFRYTDNIRKNNPYIREILPKLHHIDTTREIQEIQDDIFLAQGNDGLSSLRDMTCMFDSSKPCINCYQCIGVIERKEPLNLSVAEAAKLLEYKLLRHNPASFLERLNYLFQKNMHTAQEIRYTLNSNIGQWYHPDTVLVTPSSQVEKPVQMMSAGMKSIFIFTLLEAYIEENSSIPCIIMIEDPEIFLHPELQKTASEILYRLSKKNQVIFSTHSPNMIFNFNSRQIKQVVLDESCNTTVKSDTDIDEILDDLGYTANDFMNVNFVFIVEGKQDSSRLPLLLRKYYSEIYDDKGRLSRIAIVSTNSCTNIKTYANLKYINKVYLKDQFLMIRDGDGKDHDQLVGQLCQYYKDRESVDRFNLPRVMPRNVLVLKYYSFENYFLDAEVMAKIGVISSEEDFYRILSENYTKYLHRITSVRKLFDEHGITFETPEKARANMELIKTYVRGHNLFDMFYGQYKGEREAEILNAYIEAAPRSNWEDILASIDSFVYFDSRRK